MSAPLILNTRPREQAAELSELLRQAGCAPLEVPVIEIQPAWDPAELEAARAALGAGAFDWVVVASQNAGKALESELRASRVVCGSATARALGITAELSLRHFSASAALHVLGPLVGPGQRILLPRAARGRDELLDGLRGLGASVSAPIAYRTAAIEPHVLRRALEPLRSGTVAAVTVCSPSAIRALCQAIGPVPLRETTLVCLGETTAQAAGEAGLRVDAVATRPTMESLVRGVQLALSRQRTLPEMV